MQSAFLSSYAPLLLSQGGAKIYRGKGHERDPCFEPAAGART